MIFTASDELHDNFTDQISYTRIGAEDPQSNQLYNANPSRTNSESTTDGTLDICTNYDVAIQTYTVEYVESEPEFESWVNYTFGMY